ncbi:cobalt-precorrin-6A reductase [Pelagimonas phthalicica]|uniref:cobalt-precorrin-6A reductase n=1 Tax=Pelagimonas phthalicica TaxID=1037362 RepID=UPI000C06DE1E|nr:cobalt-precorrin-6A reductase [Pelagimonas phthalicica]TDS91277.1 precorrin-6A/cobalt-precorrin-6A reductase [Pelagimonas phthalicica]
MARTLILGGTTEASRLAHALAERGSDAVFSYAGRTINPVAQPLPTRVGGFGGVEGLVAYLRQESITHVVDATHPFAAQMSRNAVAACAAAGVDLCALERPAWRAMDGDIWQNVASIEQAVAALPDRPKRVFLAIGKQNLSDFAAAPQHHYLLRLVDPPQGDLPLPNTSVVIARGPFDTAQDTALLQSHKIDLIIAKNAGGRGAEAKILAARALKLPVIMINRPQVPERLVFGEVDQIMGWLGH